MVAPVAACRLWAFYRGLTDDRISYRSHEYQVPSRSLGRRGMHPWILYLASRYHFKTLKRE